MFVVRCSLLRVVCWLLFVCVRCSLFVVRGLLLVVCCVLLFVCSLLFVRRVLRVACLLVVGWCLSLVVVCCCVLLFVAVVVVRCVLFVVGCRLNVICWW